jgi:hypothetical protein
VDHWDLEDPESDRSGYHLKAREKNKGREIQKIKKGRRNKEKEGMKENKKQTYRQSWWPTGSWCP